MVKKSWAARMGKLIRVPNRDRRFGANTSYLCTKLQLPDGREQIVLLTDHQVRAARRRALHNNEDLVDVPALRDLFD